MQYTIRSIPSHVDTALRQRAQKSGKSLNEVALEALAKGAGVIAGATFNDLDWFIGSKSLDNNFEDDIDWLNRLPREMK